MGGGSRSRHKSSHYGSSSSGGRRSGESSSSRAYEMELMSFCCQCDMNGLGPKAMWNDLCPSCPHQRCDTCPTTEVKIYDNRNSSPPPTSKPSKALKKIPADHKPVIGPSNKAERGVPALLRRLVDFSHKTQGAKDYTLGDSTNKAASAASENKTLSPTTSILDIGDHPASVVSIEFGEDEIATQKLARLGEETKYQGIP